MALKHTSKHLLEELDTSSQILPLIQSASSVKPESNGQLLMKLRQKHNVA